MTPITVIGDSTKSVICTKITDYEEKVNQVLK